jgi:His-Xaa-Ser system radical SAM maturase HxsB
VQYNPVLFPFRFHRLSTKEVVAVSESGDHIYLSQDELENLVHNPQTIALERLAELKSKFFVGERSNPGVARLLASRIAAKKETILCGPSLHIIVPTLQCAHSCRYCQVSRSLEDTGFSMSIENIEKACNGIFESPSSTLTVEFQGGDPLLRFDLIRHAIEKIANRNKTETRNIRFVVASTLHQLTQDMLSFLKLHQVYLSTSIDGPAALHNKNRPLPSRDSYERTLAGIELARRHLGQDAVSALMTTTRDSLEQPEAIIDEYVALGFNEIFIRWLSPYGYAKRNERVLAYPFEDFKRFYQRAFERILYWNREGVPIREVAASIALNKILSPFDAGYVDLQSPSGAVLAALVYNYDGWVYPSDEGRMLAESGDTSLRLGRIGDSLTTLLNSSVAKQIVRASLGRQVPGCCDCAFNPYCGPDPVSTQSQYGRMDVPVYWTEHCKRYKWFFELIFRRLREPDPWFQNLAYGWAKPAAEDRVI